MPMNITVKNIPDEMYDRLKKSAEINHRSINNEVISCLERVLLPRKITVEEHLERAHELRSQLKGPFSAKDIMKAIKEKRM